MEKKLRKIYLHLDAEVGKVHFVINPLAPRDMQSNATHHIEFRHRGMYTRVWVNLFDLKLRRDLMGWYLTDFRSVGMSDKLICTRAMRDEVSKKRPYVGYCQWREFSDDY